MHDASSCTTPSAFGTPPYPTLYSSGSSSVMLTPAMSESSTSDPFVIIENAFSTHVMVPPFLKTLPFSEAMTIGLAVFGPITAGPPPKAVLVEGSASPAAAPVRTKSRRVSFFFIVGFSGSAAASIDVRPPARYRERYWVVCGALPTTQSRSR